MKRTTGNPLHRTGKRLSVSLLWDCNQRCGFCAKGRPPRGVRPRLSLEEALAVLRAGRRDGYDFLALDGGEPSIYPELRQVVLKALELGYRSVNILTNGTGLAAGGLLRGFPARHRKRLSFCVSLHSHLPAVSDKLTGSPGSFAKTLEGIRAARGAGFTFSLYHVITALNWRALPAYAAFVAKNFPEAGAVTFSYMFPAEHLRAGLGLYPRLGPAAAPLAEGARLLQARGLRVELSACGVIPLCLARGSERILLNTALEKRFMTFDTMKMEPRPFLDADFNGRTKKKAPRCAGCFVDRACGGIWKFYAGKFGLSELRPFKGDYFRKLPGSGGASLDLASSAAAPDPLAPAMASLIGLRYRGVSKLNLLNEAALGGAAEKLRTFAREAGFTLVPAGRRLSPKPRRAGPRRR